jgi:hypothetical protein
MRFLIMSFWKSSEFYAVTMPLCSHQALMHSSWVLCGHHAVEVVQGKGVLGPSLSRCNEGLGVGSR